MVDRRPSQWKGLPIPTQGQQAPYESVHRYDLLGPFEMSATGLLKYSNGVELHLPYNCIVTEFFLGNPGGSTITVSLEVAGGQPDVAFEDIEVPSSGTGDVLGLTRTSFCIDGDDPDAALVDPTADDPVTVELTALSGGTVKIWIAIIRWVS